MERRPAALDAWSAELAPLSEKQRLSVSKVALQASERPEAQPHAAAEQTALVSSSLGLAQWLSSIQLGDTSHDHRLASLQAEIAALDALVAQIDTAQELVGELNDGLEFVISHSSELISQAAQLADGQTQLEELYTQIAGRLEFFAVLPHVTSVLAASSPQSLDIGSIVEVIERVSQALDFMSRHPQYLDARVYHLRLENSLSRVAELARSNFARAGNALAHSCAERIREFENVPDFSSPDGVLALDSMPLQPVLYQEFALGEFRPLFAKLEKINDEPCRNALSDCQAMWCNWRASLLRGVLVNHFKIMQQADCVTMAKQAADVLGNVCAAESRLYSELFSLPQEPVDGQLRTYLRSFGKDILAALGPKLGGVSVEQLAQVCSTVHEKHGYDGEWTFYVLHDLCMRLLADADALLRRDVAQFKPDVAQLPDTMRPLAQQHTRRQSLLGIELTDEHAPLFSAPESVSSTWYAPVRTTNALLAALHTRVPLHPFIEFAAKALDACVTSVERAATALRESGPSGAADADAFSLRHLFLIKELYYMVDLASKQENVALQFEDIGSQSFFGAQYDRVGLVLEAVQSVWYPKPPANAGELAPVLARIDKAIETASVQLSTYFGSSIALPLRVFVAQKQRNSSPNADAAWDTFQQSLDVNLAEMHDRLAGAVRDPHTIEQLQEATLCYRRMASSAQRSAAHAKHQSPLSCSRNSQNACKT
ncbi:Golgi transport complex subunit 3 [Malassezia cuniculi]|uniref:Conserved oligomeric Golgi complex subunit 3 n=1 Tax=Malassezia cuniculi TaxID=948313 RepID=A0AAF0ES59_9BASI|nr:Golgi transport complex subunit 3 [Malassezia cuniculi]